MAAVNITLDTETRQVSLMVDGVTIPNAEIFFEYFHIEIGEGEMEKITNFHYSIMETNEAGLQEKRMFRLPPPEPEEESNMLLPNGLASMTDEDLFKKNVATWFKNRRS